MKCSKQKEMAEEEFYVERKRADYTEKEEQIMLERLYPNEKWNWDNGENAGGKSKVYISPSRSKDALNRKEIFDSDKEMAMTLARELQQNVYMLPELDMKQYSKNPDVFVNGATLEMKRVNGSRDKIGKNTIKALKQSDNVFLYVKTNIPIISCLNKIRGSLKVHKELGKELPDKNNKLYVYTEGKMYVFVWKSVLP